VTRFRTAYSLPTVNFRRTQTSTGYLSCENGAWGAGNTSSFLTGKCGGGRSARPASGARHGM